LYEIFKVQISEHYYLVLGPKRCYNRAMSLQVIFVFLDGVGLGPAGDKNPFWLAPMPNLRQLLGGPLVDGHVIERPGMVLKGIDACLGVEGLPQSATGQTALFTGINAAQILGYHLTAYPNAPLTELINEHNILKRATESGYRATFANAYTPTYFQLVEEGKRRHSATTLSVLAAELPFRLMADLERGQAVYWDITHRFLNEYLKIPIPVIEPELAGQRLARLADEHDLVLYECFLPDLIGHRKNVQEALILLETLDRFLAGLLNEMRPTVNLVVSSDHGNLEDMGIGIHTTNPVPLLVVGPGAGAFREAQAITDVAGGIMAVLRGESYRQRSDQL
jgi:2,3-bisphosphoglycerate-independent phosphoglycerate mutase